MHHPCSHVALVHVSCCDAVSIVEVETSVVLHKTLVAFIPAAVLSPSFELDNLLGALLVQYTVATLSALDRLPML